MNAGSIRHYLQPKDGAPHVGAAQLAEFVARAKSVRANNVHIRKGLPPVYRVAGKNSSESATGLRAEAVPTGLFDQILAFVLHPESNTTSADNVRKTSVTRVFECDQVQIRVQYSAHQQPETLVLRIQPLSPFPLESYFAADVQNMLSKATGLYVVCGKMGAGKTTLAASIAQHWAGLGKHVAVVADPVEYYIPTEKYLVSHFECALTAAARREGIPFIDAIVPDIFRNNVDAMFISEIRDSAAIPACLELSRTREPVITTFHASSIGDCVIGLLGMADGVMSPEIARTFLSNCLEGIFYIDLVYHKDTTIPVVQFLPVNKIQALKKAISLPDPRMIISAFDAESEKNHHNGTCAITRPTAQSIALQRGIPKAILSEVLPPPSVQN